MANRTATPNNAPTNLMAAITRFRKALKKWQAVADEESRKNGWIDRFDSAINARDDAAYSLAMACLDSDVVQQLEAENAALKVAIGDADTQLANLRERQDEDYWDMSWVEYLRKESHIKKNFGVEDTEWLLNQHPSPIQFAARLDRVIANEKAMADAKNMLTELGQFCNQPPAQMVKALYSLDYWWCDEGWTNL